MDYSTILSHASRLKRSSLYRVTIAEATKDALIDLNAAISKAHENGLSRVEYRLPINFRHIDDSVSNTELQIAIYYNIVMELERKEYEVRIQFSKKHTTLKVSWCVKAGLIEVNDMQKKLLSLRE